MIEPGDESDMDIRRGIELACTCIKALSHGIWRRSISLSTKLRLYNVYYQYISTEPTHGVWLASKRRLERCLRPVVPAIYDAYPIHGTCFRSESPLQNRSTAGHFPCKVETAEAVRPYCPSRTSSGSCTRTASFHQSYPRGLALPKRSPTPAWWQLEL